MLHQHREGHHPDDQRDMPRQQPATHLLQDFGDHGVSMPTSSNGTPLWTGRPAADKPSARAAQSLPFTTQLPPRDFASCSAVAAASRIASHADSRGGLAVTTPALTVR